MRTIGLTGGMASGKSTVAQMFRALGIPVVDADVLAREVVAPGSSGLALLAARFPDCVAGGALDRKKLGARVFADPIARADLNAITHPLIAQAAQARMKQLADAGHPVAIYEAALIVENRLDAAMDGLVVVSLAEDLQRARLSTRDGLSDEQARARISAQLPLHEKLARATWVVDNGGGVGQTEDQVRRIWREIVGGTS